MSTEQQDEAFLSQAQRQRLLNAAQASMLRSELRRRRAKDPAVQVHELAVSRGLLAMDDAMAVLEAVGGGAAVSSAVQTRPPEPPDDDHFEGVPRFVEAIPDKQDVQKKSGDSVLEMDMPPPTERSGDSLFEDGSNKERSSGREPSDSSVEVAKSPAQYFERHMDAVGGNGDAPAAPDALDSLSSDEFSEQEEVEPAQDAVPQLAADDGYFGAPAADQSPPELEQAQPEPYYEPPTLDDAPLPPMDAPEPAAFATATESAAQTMIEEPWGDAHAATMPPTLVEAMPEMPATEYEVMPGDAAAEVSHSSTDSAIMDAFREADSNYFGPAADLTHPPTAAPPEPEVSVADEMPQITLFDSSAIVAPPGSAAHQPVADEEEDFTRTKPPAAPEPGPRSATVTEVEDDSEFDLSLAGLEGEVKEPSSKASTIYDDSEVSEEELTGRLTKPAMQKTTGSASTGMATGEVARKGAAKAKKAIGVESDITGEKLKTGEQIEASQMTLAQLRNKMGIGEGIKIDAGADRIVTTLDRLKSGGSGQRRYTVVREIARGGMGKVLQVEDNDLRRSVALKVLRKEMLGRKDLVERFLEEAQITGQLEHPNIVPVHEIGVDGRGNLYFTMKLVEGEDLSSIIKRLRNKDEAFAKKWPLSRLLEVYIKVCEGLAFAHSRGVIHRDLKPANIMVGRFGEAQIMDWGVAKIVGRKDKPQAGERTVLSDRHEGGVATTMVGAILGTPTYMSPEQARGETESLTPSSDIFSLGVILYELLSLKLPWSGRTSDEVLDQVREVMPEPPSKKAPDRKIPPELESLAMICLAKEPAKRIASVADLLDNLKSYQEGRTLAAVQYSMTQLFLKWLSRNRVMVITSALVLCALIGGVIATMTIIRQQQLEKIPALLQQARGSVDDAQGKLAAQDFKGARDAAVAAQGQFDQARRIDEDNAEANNGFKEAASLVGAISFAEDQFNREKNERAAKLEREKKLGEALEAARKLAAAARELEAGADISRTREAKSEARDAFIAVQAIDSTNTEAFNAINELSRWIDDYEKNRERLRSRQRVETLRQQAAKLLEETRTVRAYDQAKVKLQAVLTACDQALAEASGDDREIVAARNSIQMTKADAALDFTRRALEQAPPQFEIADLMLAIADNTGQRTDLVKSLREEHRQKSGLFSTFRRMMTEASDALNSQSYSLAAQKAADALREARTSPFATRQDRESLEKMIQFANMEDARAREQKATGSESLRRSVDEYERLLEKTITDADYKTRCEGYLAAARDRLGRILMSEATGTDEAVAREKLTQALAVLTDRALIVEVRDKLAELTAKAALAQVSDRVVLLPRGTFVVGSTRDSDQNPMRQVEHHKLVFIDKFPVTNQNYLDFVKAGGYEKGELWDREALPLVTGFVDSTGKPGPKNWKDGAFDPAVAQLPVTGLCWYEARAYARWQKKRLPTAEEWEIAAGAPDVRSAERAGDYTFGSSEDAPPDGVLALREVGTAEWDRNALGIRDLGVNSAEWTDSRSGEDRAVVKGAQPGLKLQLFLRFARRAKVSSARLADRSEGRGFRCVHEFREK